MTVIPAHQLEASDLRRLGRDLCDQVRDDRQHPHAAVDRSLALHDEQLAEEDAAAIDAACAGEAVAS